MNELLHIIGAEGISAALWGGIISCAGMFTAVFLWYWHHRCHVHHCVKFGHHPVGDGSIIVCRRHHPALPRRIRPAHVWAAHRRRSL